MVRLWSLHDRTADRPAVAPRRRRQSCGVLARRQLAGERQRRWDGEDLARRRTGEPVGRRFGTRKASPMWRSRPIHRSSRRPGRMAGPGCGALGSDTPYVQINWELRCCGSSSPETDRDSRPPPKEKDAQPFAVRVWSTKDGTPAGNWIRGQPGWTLADMDLAPDGAHVVAGGTLGCYCARLWNAFHGNAGRRSVGAPQRRRVGALQRHRHRGRQRRIRSCGPGMEGTRGRARSAPLDDRRLA